MPELDGPLCRAEPDCRMMRHDSFAACVSCHCWGAPAALTVADFDAPHKLSCIGHDKAGEGRFIPLPPATAKLIAEQARSKLPGAPLFARWDDQHGTSLRG